MMLRHALCSALLLTPCFAASNWPQFRGEGGLGIGTGSPPVEFSAEKNLKWQAEVPFGHSSPCIWEDKIALTALDGGKLVTFCLSRTDGHELWRAAAPAEKVEGAHRIGSPATPTCCTDGTRLIAYFGSYGVLAYDWNGKPLWEAPAASRRRVWHQRLADHRQWQGHRRRGSGCGQLHDRPRCDDRRGNLAGGSQ